MNDPRMKERTAEIILVTSIVVGTLISVAVSILSGEWVLIIYGPSMGFVIAYAACSWYDDRRWFDAIARGERPWE